MRKSMLGVFMVLFALAPVFPSAQEAGTTPATATDLTGSAIQAAMKKAVEDLRPGVTVNDRLVSLPDMGRYNVGVAVVARPAGTFQSYLSHDKITEVYYVLRGTGVQVTGTMVNGTRGATASKTIGPGTSSTVPLKNSHSSKLGPGDVQIIPPGLGHGWTSIEPGGIEYLIFRIDPDHVLALP